jgi:iron(III) transport system substrate-binding protein
MQGKEVWMQLRRLAKRSSPIAAALMFLFIAAFQVSAQTEAELMSGAKKEGKVVYWTTMRLPDAQALAQGFESKYPFVKAEIVRISGDQLIERAITEYRAGTVTADVLDAFSFKVLQNRGLLQPFATPESAFYSAEYKDPQNLWVTLYCAYNVIAYNTKLVAPADAPKDWPDLLNPKWKGKLALDDQDYYWYAGMLRFWGEEKGRKYMQDLARQDLIWRRGRGLLTELMASGEFHAVVVTFPDMVEQMKAKGQPVEWVKTSNPILVTLDMMGIGAKAPHPNAGKLFMNYSISKEGQEVLRKTNRISARTDIKPLVPEMDRSKLRLVPLDPEIPITTKYIDEFRKTFGIK